MVFTISYRGHGIGERAATDRGAVLQLAFAQLHFGAHRSQQPPLGLDVAHLGNVFEGDFILSENGRGHAGQRRVLRARDANGADQRIAAANDELIHRYASFQLLSF